MLRIEGLSKSYGAQTVLRDVTFAVAPGELVVLMGPSGSGKTTLFRCIGRLVEPDAGRVLVDGRDVAPLRGSALRAARRDVALVFQQFNLVRRASVRANVLAGRLGTMPAWRVLTRRFPAAAVTAAEACLARVGLDGLADRRADTLSGGQQQRVAIARALAQRSRVVLADEPVASLDADNAARILDLLRGLAKEDGLAVLCALHQPALARAFADRILVLRDGGVVDSGRGLPVAAAVPRPLRTAGGG